MSDLNKFGYNNFLRLKEDYLNLIKEEISLKNSTISYKGKKNFESLQDHLSEESNFENIFSKSLEKKIYHVALDINISKTSYIQELATSNFFMDLQKNTSIIIVFQFQHFVIFQIQLKPQSLKKRITLSISIMIMILKNFLKFSFI